MLLIFRAVAGCPGSVRRPPILGESYEDIPECAAPGKGWAPELVPPLCGDGPAARGLRTVRGTAGGERQSRQARGRGQPRPGRAGHQMVPDDRSAASSSSDFPSHSPRTRSLSCPSEGPCATPIQDASPSWERRPACGQSRGLRLDLDDVLTLGVDRIVDDVLGREEREATTSSFAICSRHSSAGRSRSSRGGGCRGVPSSRAGRRPPIFVSGSPATLRCCSPTAASGGDGDPDLVGAEIGVDDRPRCDGQLVASALGHDTELVVENDLPLDEAEEALEECEIDPLTFEVGVPRRTSAALMA